MSAAAAGAIPMTWLIKRGVAGVMADGGFRDSAEITNEAFEMTAYEGFVTEQACAGTDLHLPTNGQSLVDFSAWRKANGR